MGCHATRVKGRRIEVGVILFMTLSAVSLVPVAGCGRSSTPEVDSIETENSSPMGIGQRVAVIGTCVRRG